MREQAPTPSDARVEITPAPGCHAADMKETPRMARQYTADERNTWLDVAQDVGVPAAMKELGYPARRTATNWVREAGLDWSDHPQQITARAVQQAYNDAELLAVGTALLDKAMDLIEHGEPVELPATVGGGTIMVGLTPSGLDKVSRTFHRTVETMRLIQGRSTGNLAVQVEDLNDTQRDRLAASRKANEAVLLQLVEAS